MDYAFGNTPGVVKSTYGARGKSQVAQQISKPQPLGVEHNPWHWNPFHCSVRLAPAEFRARVKRLDPDLEITWNPILERWMLWVRAPKLNTPICHGWRLLFIHWDADHSYLPLDERFLARLYMIDSTRLADAANYFRRVADEFQRDEELKRKRLKQEAIDQAMPFWDHSRISVSMRGKSNGSKFSKYHA